LSAKQGSVRRLKRKYLKDLRDKKLRVPESSDTR
jgi:hypothetical protein